MSETAEPQTVQEPPEPEDPTAAVNRLAQISIALIPALVAALAAIGGATGGLARLFRDQTGVASRAVALILLSFALAAFARFVGAGRPQSERAAGGGPAGRLAA